MEFTLFEVTHPPIEIATGMRIRHNGKTVIFTGDTNLDIPEKSLEMMRGLDLLIADAIVPPHIHLDKHMNAEDAMKLAGQLNPKRTVLVHLAHMYPPHDETVKKSLLGYDGPVIDL
jgi:phosphoribosyl 1,2-cyclic phosphate phosphodiesterase